LIYADRQRLSHRRLTARHPKEFADLANQRLGGRVMVNSFTENPLGREGIEGVRRGVIEMGMISMSGVSTIVPEAAVRDSPLLLADLA
jgi:TRAP-type C4-dicarboxylate transport system substrate-binding protein